MMSTAPIPRSRARLITDYLARPVLPFRWAGANCCRFAADWVLLAEHRDPMAGLPATPTARAAQSLVKRLGGTLQAAWTQQLQREPIPAQQAQQGDVVLVDLQHQGEAFGVGTIAGVCTGPAIAIATAEGHIAFLPLSAGDAAWRIEVRP